MTRDKLKGICKLAVAAAVLAGVGCGGGEDGKSPEARTTTVPLAVEINTETGRIGFAAKDGSLALKNGVIRLAVPEDPGVRWFASGEYPEQSTSSAGEVITWTLSGLAGAPDLEVKVRQDAENADIEIGLGATNTGGTDLFILGAEIPAFVYEWGGGVQWENPTGSALLLHNGFQSWSYSGPMEINGDTPVLSREYGTLASAGDNDEWFDEEPGLSWWMTALTAPGADSVLTLGALSAENQKTYIGIEIGDGGLELRLVEGMPVDWVILAPGESLEFEPVYLGADRDPIAGLNRYARAAAEVTPPLVWTGDPPWGWASWYYYYTRVKEEDIFDNLNFVRDELSTYGFNLVQLDDGYMPRWGEWTNNSKFPSGLDGIAGEIESAGLWPGIWIAPFLVSADSDLVAKNHDWFLRNTDGALILYQQPPSGIHAILDVTHPDAETWLSGVIRGIRDAGFRMIKIDFIFTEAFEGVRHDPQVTSMQAYHRGLEIIREAAGEEMFILACGAPMLPTLGHAHAFRTGPDIAYEAVNGGNPNYNFLVHEARNTVSRFFTGGNWFLNDPDQLLLREPLTLEEAKMFAVANVMAGGVFLLGDDLTSLGEDRLAIATNPAILEIAKIGKPAVPLDLFDAASQKLFSSPVVDLAGESTAPSIWWLEGEKRTGYLAFFNWRGDSREIEIETGKLSPSSPREIREVFSGEKIKVKDGKISAQVASHQVKLFKIKY